MGPVVWEKRRCNQLNEKGHTSYFSMVLDIECVRKRTLRAGTEEVDDIILEYTGTPTESFGQGGW